MAMVRNCVRQGTRTAAPALLAMSSGAVLADPSSAIAMHQSDNIEARKAPALSSGGRRTQLEWRSSRRASCGPYPSSRRTLFMNATTKQVALQNLSGSEEGITVLTLNRPGAKNAIGVEMLSKLRASLENVQFHSSARILIICSTVSGVFCAGADLKEMKRSLGFQRPVSPLFLSCSGHGRTAGGTQRLPRIIGRARAKELIYTGCRIDGQHAEAIGPLNHSVQTGNAYQKAVDIAQEITKQSPLAVKLAKVAIERGSEVDTASGMTIEEACYAQVLKSKDRFEGLAAFAEKRKPWYRGE